LNMESNAPPRGVLVPLPIAFSKDAPNPILWELIDYLVDWYTNSEVSGIWTGSPASEISFLTNEEVFEFTKRVMQRCGPRSFPVVASVKPNQNLAEYAESIKKIYALGVKAVVLDLNSLAEKGDPDSTVEKNLNELISLVGNIPLGIYESKLPYHRLLSPQLLKTIAGLPVWFFIDSSLQTSSLNAKLGALGNDFRFSIRCFVTQGTQLSQGMSQGVEGFAGPAASFMPKIYAAACQKTQSTTAPLASFLSLAEPTVDFFYPFNLKIFLKFHLGQENLEAVSRHPSPTVTPAMEDSILRITHLNDAAKFIVSHLEDPKGKKQDRSVIL